MGRRTIISWRSTPFSWAGLSVVIVGAGPSAVKTNLDRIRTKVIVINSSWRLAPWADCLYGSDGLFWLQYRGVPEFKGVKFTSSPFAAKQFGLETLFTEGNNSGLRAIRLVEALGAKRAFLVGFEHHVKDGSHWHEPYGGRLHNPGKSQAQMWCLEMEKAQFNIEVINCTPGSALRCFPMVSFEEVMNEIEDGISCGADRQGYRDISRRFGAARAIEKIR